MAERLLVTGASGFIGQHMPALLRARGYETHVTARATLPETAGITAHSIDLLRQDEAQRLIKDLRPDIIIHTAWYVAHGRFWTAPENTDWLEASTALAAYAAEAGTRRFVGIGTCAEYATEAGDDAFPWPETRPIAPATPYGEAKATLAQRLSEIAEARARFGVAWARLFHLFGPAENPARLVPSIMLALREGREAQCASGRPVRDFISTQNAAAAITALATSQVTGPVNIASGAPISIAAMARLIAHISGRPYLLRLGALPDRPNEPPYMVAHTGRLRREVGFTAPVSLASELRKLQIL
ncbi:MAG: NAD-dependent epimerase/dehydratase family protein [Roseomonas sp.]|nr:NAD-dependent epimerase/dehydratase family protein [Roseomonas sp.]MCA3317598.1 NAD-dependent epimerase/dehydratase family protein [Roseomonas sp.]MCA3319304.1 NAD-dependent epimerase/dehydratase family protein [Roseomonas sp.]